MISKTLFSNKFPKYLKKTDKAPVFKKDEKFLKTNYRPVSILSTVSKIYERCLYDQINEYFQHYFQNYSVVSVRDIVHNIVCFN